MARRLDRSDGLRGLLHGSGRLWIFGPRDGWLRLGRPVDFILVLPEAARGALSGRWNRKSKLSVDRGRRKAHKLDPVPSGTTREVRGMVGE
jgi:hypothetical protein